MIVWAWRELRMPPDVARRQSLRDLHLLNAWIAAERD